ncbi:hypothetical protein [Gottfriedia solisilvae]|uniref:hypothetical protein n=1 Tax=Gottfriedia solisilvae TaxID=1516104 RepID=UPI003D2F2F98
MKRIYILLIVAIIFSVTLKPSSSYAYNGYRLDSQSYGSFDYRDISPSINAQKGYMIVTLTTEKEMYGKDKFASKKYSNLNGIYKMKYYGLYTFDFYIKNQKVQSISYFNQMPPKVMGVKKTKDGYINIYQKVAVKL